MQARHEIRHVRFLAPLPFGVEVMTLSELREMAAPGYLDVPQRPAFHVLILGLRGHATHTVDFVERELGPGRGVWVRPGQVQRFRIQAGRADGTLVLFSPESLLPGTRSAALAADPFGPASYAVSPRAAQPLQAAADALGDEYARARRATPAAPVDTGELLLHLLSIVVLRFAAVAGPASASDSGDLHDAFRRRLERDFTVAHDAAHYARALGYSTRTLSRVTQRAVGRTPKQLICERIALEASRLLAHTDQPVGSIAAQLGFGDPSNFATFFVRQTGMVPGAFRARQRLSHFDPKTSEEDHAQDLA